MSVDYSTILKRKHPTVIWNGSGATYDRIKWVDPAIAQADLDALAPVVEFEVAAERAQARLIDGYQAATRHGFMSDALGSPHWYPAELENQVDLIGAVVTSQIDNDFEFPFPCADLTKTPPQQKIEMHDDHEIEDVMKDGASYKVFLFEALEEQLVALYSMSLAELKAAQYAKP